METRLELGYEGVRAARDLITVLDLLIGDEDFMSEARNMERMEMIYGRDQVRWAT